MYAGWDIYEWNNEDSGSSAARHGGSSPLLGTEVAG
jgi:hypothetical protein